MRADDRSTEIRIEFLEQLRKDQAAGTDRDLAGYQALFPGGEAIIAEEWARRSRSRQGSTWDLDADDGFPPPSGLAPARARGPSNDVEFHEPSGVDPQPDETQFGSYRLLKRLGRGGQGEVWLATDTRLPGRHLAIKVLNRRDPVVLERFRREALAASLIRHPGICTIYEFSIEGESPFIAMEYIAGQSLGDHIRSSRIHRAPGTTTSGIRLDDDTVPTRTKIERPPRTPNPARALSDVDRVLRTAHLVEVVALALHEAHEKDLVHRDIKPDNLLVRGGTFEPVIVDFGLAHHDKLEPITVTGQFLGSVPYMSPEQLPGSEERPDRRTDIWSLGITLYECLTITRPFDRADETATLLAIKNDPVSDPRRCNPAIPSDLWRVIQKALSKHRNDRYLTAAAFAEDLRRVQAHEPILARRTSAALRLWRWSQRNPAVAVLTFGLFLALATGLAVTLSLYLSLQAETTRTKSAVASEQRTAATTAVLISSMVGRAEFAAAHAAIERARALGTVDPTALAFAELELGEAEMTNDTAVAAALDRLEHQELTQAQQARVRLRRLDAAISPPTPRQEFAQLAAQRLLPAGEQEYAEALAEERADAILAALRRAYDRNAYHHPTVERYVAMLLLGLRFDEARRLAEQVRVVAPSDPLLRIVDGLEPAANGDLEKSRDAIATLTDVLPAADVDALQSVVTSSFLLRTLIDCEIEGCLGGDSGAERAWIDAQRRAGTKRLAITADEQGSALGRRMISILHADLGSSLVTLNGYYAGAALGLDGFNAKKMNSAADRTLNPDVKLLVAALLFGHDADSDAEAQVARAMDAGLPTSLHSYAWLLRVGIRSSQYMAARKKNSDELVALRPRLREAINGCLTFRGFRRFHMELLFNLAGRFGDDPFLAQEVALRWRDLYPDDPALVTAQKNLPSLAERLGAESSKPGSQPASKPVARPASGPDSRGGGR